MAPATRNASKAKVAPGVKASTKQVPPQAGVSAHEKMVDLVDLPLPPLPANMLPDLPTEAEISQLPSALTRTQLRSASGAYAALGTAQALVNLLDTDRHSPTVLQQAISAQLGIGKLPFAPIYP